MVAVLESMFVLLFIYGAAFTQSPESTIQSEDCIPLYEGLSNAQRIKTGELPILEEQIRQVNQKINELDVKEGQGPKNALVVQRTELETRVRSIEMILTAYRAAVDACEATTGYRTELKRFTSTTTDSSSTTAADVAAIQTQLEHIGAARDTLTQTQIQNTQRFGEIDAQYKDANETTRTILDLERSVLDAERIAIVEKIKSHDAQHSLMTEKIRAISGTIPTTLPVTRTGSEPTKEEAEAQNKQRMAEQLDALARDQLGHAQRMLSELQAQQEQHTEDELDRKQIENDIEYWLRVEQFEQRGIKQAELVQRAAQEKKSIVQQKSRLDEIARTRTQLLKDRADLTMVQRQEQALGYNEQQSQALNRSKELLNKSEMKAQEAEPLQKILPSLDAIETALRDRVLGTKTPAARQQMEDHYRRMLRQIDSERQQIDLMIMTTENIAFAIAQQAELEQQQAAAFSACADILVPPTLTFWERHRRILNSIQILALAFGATYGLKLIMWLVERVLSAAQRLITTFRVSLKRLGTLLGFFGSIIKLFVWVFAAIAILNEFGIDPKQSSGAIGLIGLILAGMFQQIVVDFVKGLDIVIGKHYHVGEFVEVDGKFGHVVDFNVKHTRIRTLSGQEFNLPNSRCIPSRRFPDGFVTNLVDIPFSNMEEAEKAKPIVEAVGRDLNQRIEPMRDEPRLERHFHELEGRIIGRYRIRVLPGCPWVIADYFVPEVKAALKKNGIELTLEPNCTFINRVETFRKLFNRQLTEDEIIREVQDSSPSPLVETEPKLEHQQAQN